MDTDMKLRNIDPSLLMQQTPKAAPADKGPKNDPEALRETSQQFEAIFIQTMFKAMRSTVPDGGLFKKGMSQGAFIDLMDGEVAKSAASQGGIGIGEALFRQLQIQPGDDGESK